MSHGPLRTLAHLLVVDLEEGLTHTPALGYHRLAGGLSRFSVPAYERQTYSVEAPALALAWRTVTPTNSLPS